MNTKRPQKYSDASSFRQALESRLKSISIKEGVDLERLRKQVVFDRLLARIFFDLAKPKWLLKGGYAMELRYLGLARTTKDIDLAIPMILPGHEKNPSRLNQIRDELQSLANRNLEDWFVYFIQTPVMELNAAPYGGARFPVETRLAGRRFANFNLDVGIGDALIFEPEWRKDHDLLKFAGILSAKIPLLPKEQQFAEKIHAYSLPREGNTNSRTRDLIDLILLIESETLDHGKVSKAVQATFKRRKTHEIPKSLNAPPEDWERPYRSMAEECGVTKKHLEDAFKALNEFWERIQLVFKHL